MGADLRNVNLVGADLRNANLQDADLQGALSLTQSHVDSANGNKAALLPKERIRPDDWK